MTRLVLTVLPAPDSPNSKLASWSEKLILTSNEHRLILAIAQHVVVGIVRDRVDVGRHFSLALILVANDNVVVVDGEPLVGVDSDTEETGVGIDQENFVTRFQVVDNRGLK